MFNFSFKKNKNANILDTKGNGWCVWITGLPGSGKSSTSLLLRRLLKKKKVLLQLLNSDSIRKELIPNPVYSIKERDMVYKVLVYMAKILTQNGVNVIIDATGNLRCYREQARNNISRFMEVYLVCPIEICIQREQMRVKTHGAPKQIYTDALSGSAPNVPGIGQPYEPPLNPEIKIDTVKNTTQQTVNKITLKINSL